jgi:hypothetical protein
LAGRNQKQGHPQSGQAGEQEDQQEEQGLTSQVGPVEINWPQTIGYYGGIGLALAAELIEPPIALFIGAIPLFKMLSHPSLPRPVRFVSQVLEGTAKPVGGSDEATIHLTEQQPTPGRRSSIWQEARHIAGEKRPPAHGGAGQPSQDVPLPA